LLYLSFVFVLGIGFVRDLVWLVNVFLWATSLSVFRLLFVVSLIGVAYLVHKFGVAGLQAKFEIVQRKLKAVGGWIGRWMVWRKMKKTVKVWCGTLSTKIKGGLDGFKKAFKRSPKVEPAVEVEVVLRIPGDYMAAVRATTATSFSSSSSSSSPSSLSTSTSVSTTFSLSTLSSSSSSSTSSSSLTVTTTVTRDDKKRLAGKAKFKSLFARLRR